MEPGAQIGDDVVDLTRPRHEDQCRTIRVVIEGLDGDTAKVTEELGSHTPRIHRGSRGWGPLDLELMQGR